MKMEFKRIERRMLEVLLIACCIFADVEIPVTYQSAVSGANAKADLFV
ncbi:hypothetical protein [Thalassomonas sp. RHCl1]|nr:hypothetical protein [Thalassomonas sp. RHCl1]